MTPSERAFIALLAAQLAEAFSSASGKRERLALRIAAQLKEMVG